MFDTSGIILSNRARIKTITLPKEPSAELAYFCGLMAGDGHIGIREKKHNYYLMCLGNPADERSLYDEVICPLIKKLFNVDIKAKIFQQTYGIYLSSKALVEYLTKILGLPKNRKYGQLTIPSWIKNNKFLTISYIRGLADTDFCLSLKKRYRTQAYYPVISGVSESKKFIEEIAQKLEEFGFKVSRHYDVLREDARMKKGFTITHRIHLYGHKQLITWMNVVGFLSQKHLVKFDLWKKRNESSNRKKVIEAVNESNKIRPCVLELGPI